MQRCLRQLWFTSGLHDVALRVRHIPGEHNTLADALSRWDAHHVSPFLPVSFAGHSSDRLSSGPLLSP